MEYYDSLNKTELHEFYFSKSKKLFQHPNVLKYLDEDISDTSDIKLFEEKPKPILAGRRRSMSSDKNLEEFSTRKRLMKNQTVSHFKVFILI
jgi:hypothetical protein